MEAFKDIVNQPDPDGVVPVQLAIMSNTPFCTSVYVLFLERSEEFLRLLVDGGCDLSVCLNSVSLMHFALSVASIRTDENLTFSKACVDLLLEKGYVASVL